MITKITTENQTQIQEAIHANGQGVITGDILQEKMLLLNRDFGKGELEFHDTYGNVLGMADLFVMLPPGMGRLVGTWQTFMDEYYNSDYPSGVYTKVYDGGYDGARFMGYIFLRYETATTIVVTFWVNLYSDLYSFEVAADNNWTISNVKRLNLI